MTDHASAIKSVPTTHTISIPHLEAKTIIALRYIDNLSNLALIPLHANSLKRIFHVNTYLLPLLFEEIKLGYTWQTWEVMRFAQGFVRLHQVVVFSATYGKMSYI